MKIIIHFFKVIIKKIDKILIVPITKFFLWIADKLKGNSKSFEKLLSKKSSLVFISLVLALSLFFFVDTKSIMLLETSAEVIYNQKVNAIYNEEAYVIEGLPEAVDITLIGRKSDLYLAKQLPTHDVSIDLKDLKPGTHRVSLKYKGSIETISYKLDPSIASVTIYPKVSEVRSIDIDILNQDKLNSKLVISDVEIDRQEVIIKGAEYKLNKVASVKALVDVNNLTNPDVGVLALNEISLVAYDEKGIVIDVEMVPSKITASITITSPSKVVPLKIIPIGQMAFGMSISSITSDVEEITIYGEQSVLDNISNVPIEVDVEGLSEDKSVTVTIKKPTGVRYISKNSAVVSVVLGEEATMEVEEIKVGITNLSDLYSVQATSKEDSEITVILKGVQSVLDNFDTSLIKVYVDLSGYKVGNHDVNVIAETSDLRVVCVPKVKTVNLTIKNK
jgi:YbbR domain-containing protein